MWRALGIFLGFIIGLTILGGVLSLFGLFTGIAGLPFGKAAAQLDYTNKTINMVYDAQRCSAINAQFLQLRNSVNALRNEQIPQAQTALDNYEKKLPKILSVQQQQMDGELQTNITGLQQQLSGLSAEYDTLSQRDDAVPCLGHLPTFINLNSYKFQI